MTKIARCVIKEQSVLAVGKFNSVFHAMAQHSIMDVEEPFARTMWSIKILDGLKVMFFPVIPRSAMEKPNQLWLSGISSLLFFVQNLHHAAVCVENVSKPLEDIEIKMETLSLRIKMKKWEVFKRGRTCTKSRIKTRTKERRESLRGKMIRKKIKNDLIFEKFAFFQVWGVLGFWGA